MWLNNYKWHIDYVNLAKDTGFRFEKKKWSLDKNKICMIDLDRLILEGDVGILDQLMPLFIQFNIETCENFSIIDENFMKFFRMSQLAVEYLLFCKKNLDKMIVNSKEEIKNLKLENNELKLFNDELKGHTDKLLEKLGKKDSCNVHKCTICTKTFSTEEYLKSHQERRHDLTFNNQQQLTTTNSLNLGLNIETEIKEIKEKLNNTEKLIKNEELNPKLEDTLNKNYTKVSELLMKFEMLKNQMENDFKILQKQKIYEENYSKLIQNVLEKNLNSSPSCVNNNSCSPLNEKKNCLTQTENVQENSKIVPPPPPNEEKMLIKIEEKMNKTCENLTSTMDTSLKNLETQIILLSKKLQDLENEKSLTMKDDTKTSQTKKEIFTQTLLEDKPTPKIRQKLIKKNELKVDIHHQDNKQKSPTNHNILEEGNEEENLILPRKSFDDLDRIDVVEDEDEIHPQPHNLIDGVKDIFEYEDTDTDDDETTQSESENSSKKKDLVQKYSKSLPNLRKPSFDSRKIVETKVKQRFSELGLSIDWKSIPNETYEKIMKIIKHQETLKQKTNPNFKNIKKKIMKILNEKLKIQKQNTIKQPNKVRSILSIKKPSIEINKKLYETTDSSTDDEEVDKIKRIPSNIVKKTKPYTEVIEELKKTHTSNENLTKPLLVKTFKPINSKKKVVFDKSNTPSSLSDLSIDSNKSDIHT